MCWVHCVLNLHKILLIPFYTQENESKENPNLYDSEV